VIDSETLMSDALRAWVVGLRTVLLSPLLVVGVTLATVASVVPFGLVLGTRLQTALAQQQPVSAGAVDIDPEWWMEYRAHATGLEATFAPTIIGFAAPLDNLSALIDASPRPWALAVPVAFSTIVWAFLWGGILHRFSQGRRLPLGEFWQPAKQNAPRLLLISVAAIPVYAVLYLAVHPLLFGALYNWLAGLASSERDAFFWRLVLYAIFGALLMAVALVVDYARIAAVTMQSRSVTGAISAGSQFVRQHRSAVVVLYLTTGFLFAAMLTAYGSAEIYGGSRLGGWRAVAIGQLYIVGRLFLRLVLAASEVQLWRKTAGGQAN
jgi:hypothetical protein